MYEASGKDKVAAIICIVFPLATIGLFSLLIAEGDKGIIKKDLRKLYLWLRNISEDELATIDQRQSRSA